ncbi:hypothetical protein BZL39_D00170 [Zygosaccharomyces parabailii]|nr:hypothetical protein BZL39_D00170 [Zygosaccharomyces parabailii]
MSFNSIPLIKLSDAFDDKTKPDFLRQLRHALITVGFLLLTDFDECGPNEKDFEDIKEQGERFFRLTPEVKQKIEMIHSPHFLGYTRLGNEITSGKIDWREQVDLATELPAPDKQVPIYKQLEGPNLWPDKQAAPLFRPVVTHYFEKMGKLAVIFRRLVAEAIGLEPTGFEGYFKENQQCKMKIISYPVPPLNKTDQITQGVGPHKDSDFLTYIYQASDHENTLQVQNFEGK